MARQTKSSRVWMVALIVVLILLSVYVFPDAIQSVWEYLTDLLDRARTPRSE